jgi:hypothetical protein
MTPNTDVEIVNEGSLFVFHLFSPEALTWTDEHIPTKARMTGSTFWVEHRFAEEIAAGMVADGLIVA